MFDADDINKYIKIVEWFYLCYFIALNGTYLFLTIISLKVLPKYIQKQTIHYFPSPQTGFEPPISLIVTAYNEEAVIVPSVKALLQLEYHEYEIVVINDGSKDNTLGVLTEEFDLELFPAAFRQRIKHKPVRAIYQSKKFPNLRVIDKENGGSKADASNAGINGARYGYFMPIDADTILDRKSLNYLIQPFLLNPDTVAVGGTVRIINGCQVKDGILTDIGLPKNKLALFQVLEYSRAFMSGRVGWNFFDALPLISGAFGLFNREAVISVGGYDHKSLGEDMDLVLRIHRHYRLQNKPYRVDYVVDPVCWTEVPESFSVLRKQRVRWQRGLFDCLFENRKLLFHPRGGLVSWGSVPFLLFLEGISPLVELFGYFVFIFCLFFGLSNLYAILMILLLSLTTGFLLSILTIALEEVTFRTYPRNSDLITMFWGSFIENFGYRQLASWWRLEGTIKWIFRTKSTWGAMTRTASWQTPATENKPSPPPISALKDSKADTEKVKEVFKKPI